MWYRFQRLILISYYSYCISLFCVRNLFYLFTEHLLFGLLVYGTLVSGLHQLFTLHLILNTSCFFLCGLVFPILTICFLDTNQLLFCASHTCFCWYWYKSSTKYLFKHLSLKVFRVVSATLGVARGDNAYVQKHWRAFSLQPAGVSIEKVFSKFLGYFLFYFPISISTPSRMLSNSFFFFFWYIYYSNHLYYMSHNITISTFYFYNFHFFIFYCFDFDDSDSFWLCWWCWCLLIPNQKSTNTGAFCLIILPF